ncbi:hypothetical protein QUB68_12550 [Microcoleus sp. A006_D1]|uniref:hypothetical protein n=1 Tax=Microcoleus sp. A006_D1 TaxID=3055267 RepID=UPI002FD3C295
MTEGESADEGYTHYDIFVVMASGDRLLARSYNRSKKQRKILKNIREYLNVQ